MTNSNELKVGDVLSGLDMIDTTFHKTRHELAIKNAINLIKQQAERIKELESAIRSMKESETNTDSFYAEKQKLYKMVYFK